MEATRRDVLKSMAATGVTGITGWQLEAEEIMSAGRKPLPKIALEEHFMVPDFVEYFADTYQNISPDMAKKGLDILLDFGSRRLDTMDQNGVTYSVLSLSGPGVQIEKDTATAVRKAREVNDVLAREMARQPKRYGGLGHLAMQDPAAAADELERCMKQLKFQGVMINGQTGGDYLDADKFSVFWERAEALDAPVYIHPANPVDHPAMYGGHSELWGPVCSWNFETGAHALRLVFGGVFERFPKARVILGHMGETLPITLWRYDSRWPVCHRGDRKLQQPPSFYIKRNIAITTAGVCDDVALRCAIDNMGLENVLFSVDYPFEQTDVAADFIQNAKLTDQEREAVAYGNARKLLKITAV